MTQENSVSSQKKKIIEKNSKLISEKYSIIRTPLFHKTYATNVSVNRTDVDFRVELFNEKFQTEDECVYHSDGLMILTAEAAKILSDCLSEKIKEFEKENGEIIVSRKKII
ncbi:DUF3467 domain-containing protein [Methanolapillus ohkumae]|uniref:DUF3467 domain-containing protein n=1 Tax=Methanolapillus ohkumae TaxID=3028298 RepID=A0AA96V8D9_9EURY|nr:hypothetical protein MsAm2_13100 [Methanosarcinaceae archaeon Am2]